LTKATLSKNLAILFLSKKRMQKSFLRLRFTATRYRFAGSTDSQLATLKQLSVFNAGLHRTGTRLKSEGRGEVDHRNRA